MKSIFLTFNLYEVFESNTTANRYFGLGQKHKIRILSALSKRIFGKNYTQN